MIYALVMKICSSIALTCSNPIYLKSFNNHYDCATRGYEISREILQDIGQKGVNEDKIIISFKCNENNVNKTPTSS